MRPRLVVDASALLAALIEPGERGARAAESMLDIELHAPSLLPYEVANVIRRQRVAGRLDATQVALVRRELGLLPVEYWPYEALADRVWELGGALTAYDAAYVALAERLGATLLTADRRLARAPGLRCEVTTI